jgi:hypothetical protein
MEVNDRESVRHAHEGDNEIIMQRAECARHIHPVRFVVYCSSSYRLRNMMLFFTYR